MLDHAIGPTVVKTLNQGLTGFLEKNADKGFRRLDDFIGIRRDRVARAVEDPSADEKDTAGGTRPKATPPRRKPSRSRDDREVNR